MTLHRAARPLLITGASGDVGRVLSARAARRGIVFGNFYSNPATGGGTAVRLDLRDAAATLDLVRDLQPRAIVHCAASDRSHDMAHTNRQTARSVLQAARQTGARLIALSTDMVFDGSAAPYAEHAPPAPTSDYGRVKAENDALFLSSHDDCLVVRTSLVYDFTSDNWQCGWMLRKIAAGEKVGLFVDETRSAIWVENLAAALIELADRPETGLLNVAGPQAVSRWALGCALLEALGYDPQSVAEPVEAASAAPERPRDLTLSVERASALLDTPLLSLHEARRQAYR
ncbi:MAG TPA: SDR family oxidoreductase [Aggregatilineales bacterium]|nr:SDR family oxidoreductase [Aggregatilineales bacterium]